MARSHGFGQTFPPNLGIAGLGLEVYWAIGWDLIVGKR
jgi:hypothetical protein